MRYYFRIFYRYLRRRPSSFILPAVSLSIGVSISMIALLFITHEVSYDSFHSNFNNIYEIYIKSSFNGDTYDANTTTYSTGSKVKNLNLGISAISRIDHPFNKVIISNPNKFDSKYVEHNFCFVDTNFLEAFSFKLKYGNKDLVLQKPYSVVITPKIAAKYFGKQDPIGKYLTFNNKYSLKISGIIEPNPSNSSIHYEFLCPISTLRLIQHIEKTENLNNDVALGEYETFVILKDKSRTKEIESALKQMASANKIDKDSNIAFNLVPVGHVHKVQGNLGSV